MTWEGVSTIIQLSPESPPPACKSVSKLKALWQFRGRNPTCSLQDFYFETEVLLSRTAGEGSIIYSWFVFSSQRSSVLHSKFTSCYIYQISHYHIRIIMDAGYILSRYWEMYIMGCWSASVKFKPINVADNMKSNCFIWPRTRSIYKPCRKKEKKKKKKQQQKETEKEGSSS